MPEPLTADSDIPAPRGHRITIPDDAAAAILDLHRVRQLHIAAFYNNAAQVLRSHPPTTMDRCMGSGTCNPAARPVKPCCLLCALDSAILRHIPADAAAPALIQAGTVAKQAAIDVIDANPHHGGEVFVLEHLAVLIHTEQLSTTLTPEETE